jgi:HEAT repeat protein
MTGKKTLSYTRDPRYSNSSLAASRARKAGDVDFLLGLLTSTDRFGRIAAAQHLGDLRARRAVDPLLRCLNASDDLMRVSAIKALGNIGDGGAADIIVASTGNHESASVRLTAAEALLALGDSRANDVLIAMVQDDPEDPQARRWAARKLAKIGAAEAIPALEAAVQTASVMERWRLLLTIRRLRARQRSKI